MPVIRHYWIVLLIAVLANLQVQISWAEDPKIRKPIINPSNKDGRTETKTEVDNGKTWRIYSLADLGDDANFSRWAAETIPEVIQPGTWSKESLKYYAPAKILVVSHTPGVHRQVRAFLEKLKEAVVPQKQTASVAVSSSGRAQAVMPAKFTAFGSGKTTSSVTSFEPSSASPPPMHLFHIIVEGLETEGDKVTLKNFTFRYEGEGIIDSKIASLIKSYNEQAAEQATSQGQESSKCALDTSQIVRSLQEILKIATSAVNSAYSAENQATDDSANPSPSSKDPVP